VQWILLDSPKSVTSSVGCSPGLMRTTQKAALAGPIWNCPSCAD